MKQRIKRWLTSRERQQIQRLQSELRTWRSGPYPPGHFYSPSGRTDEVKPEQFAHFLQVQKPLPGIDMRDERQWTLLQKVAALQYHPAFPEHQQPEYLYWFRNRYFGFSDALTLSGLLQIIRPNRVVEIGSGFSSAVMLDVNRLALQHQMHLTFIEPYPDERFTKLTEGQEGFTLLAQKVQEVPLELFDRLEAGDLLFVDSSHVGRFGSDVLHMLFEVMPRLKPGVVIHFHDIFYPFEYPYEWLKEGRHWNEAYLLRAFLMYNQAFQVLYSNSYLELMHLSWLEQHMPRSLIRQFDITLEGELHTMPTRGQSIYLIKTTEETLPWLEP